MDEIPPLVLQSLCSKMQGSIWINDTELCEYFKSGETLLKLLSLVGKAINIDETCSDVKFCSKCHQTYGVDRCIRSIIRSITRSQEKPQLYRVYDVSNMCIGDFTEEDVETIKNVLLKYHRCIKVSKLS